MNGRGCRRGRGGGAGSAHVCDRGCTVGGLSAAKIEILTVQAGGNYQYSLADSWILYLLDTGTG